MKNRYRETSETLSIKHKLNSYEYFEREGTIIK